MELVTSFWSIQNPSTDISLPGISIPQRVSFFSNPAFKKPRSTLTIP